MQDLKSSENYFIKSCQRPKREFAVKCQILKLANFIFTLRYTKQYRFLFFLWFECGNRIKTKNYSQKFLKYVWKGPTTKNQYGQGKMRLKINDELGVMNDEWKPIPIGDVFKFIKSYAISRDGLQSNCDDLVYCIHYGDIHSMYNSSFLDLNTKINIPLLKGRSLAIEDINYWGNDDIVMAEASEDYDGVGDAVEVKSLKGKKATDGLQTLGLRNNKKTISFDFTASFFASMQLRNKLRKYPLGPSVYSVTKTIIYHS